jgi:hypothetical protein
MSSEVAHGVRDLRVLVLARRERDSRVLCEVLHQADLHPERCATVEELGQQLQVGAGAAVLTIEALSVAGLQPLLQAVDRQPAWSALPFLLLTGGGACNRLSDGVLSSQ